MEMRVWNAYASNNSGSYTIVGSLPSHEVAASVAAELRELIEAQTTWLEETSKTRLEPLAEFCRVHGLRARPDAGTWDDWPRVAQLGNQVVVHHEYTVTLPRLFGELFYKRGGRVQHEEDHAHHPHRGDRLILVGLERASARGHGGRAAAPGGGRHLG